MAEFILDLSQYRDRVGARVAEGRYRVRVDDAELNKSKAGNPMVELWLTIQGGEFDGMTLTDRLTLTDRAMFRVVGFMQAIGLPTPRKRLKLSTDKFIGRVLDVDVEDGDPYNGRVKSEVRGYIKVTGGTTTTDDLDVPDEDTDDAPVTPDPVKADAPAKSDTDTPADTDADPEYIDLETLDLG